MDALPECMSVQHVSAPGDLKRTSNSLELELGMIVNHHGDAENRTQGS